MGPLCVLCPGSHPLYLLSWFLTCCAASARSKIVASSPPCPYVRCLVCRRSRRGLLSLSIYISACVCVCVAVLLLCYLIRVYACSVHLSHPGSPPLPLLSRFYCVRAGPIQAPRHQPPSSSPPPPPSSLLPLVISFPILALRCGPGIVPLSCLSSPAKSSEGRQARFALPLGLVHACVWCVYPHHTKGSYEAPANASAPCPPRKSMR